MNRLKILQIDGALTDDERSALHEVLTIWDRGGVCPEALLRRLPAGRVEIVIAEDADADARAIVVIDDGILAVHPLDEPLGTIH